MCLDQSASMRPTFAESAIVAATCARTPGLSTRLFAFDDRVADLTPYLDDPVDALFGAALGGGTNIAAALRAADASLERPEGAAVLLISDCIVEDADRTVAAAERILRRGARLFVSANPRAKAGAQRPPPLREKLIAIGATRLGASPVEIAAAIVAAMGDRPF